jgi:hypothetical protein
MWAFAAKAEADETTLVDGRNRLVAEALELALDMAEACAAADAEADETGPRGRT